MISSPTSRHKLKHHNLPFSTVLDSRFILHCAISCLRILFEQEKEQIEEVIPSHTTFKLANLDYFVHLIRVGSITETPICIQEWVYANNSIYKDIKGKSAPLNYICLIYCRSLFLNSVDFKPSFPNKSLFFSTCPVTDVQIILKLMILAFEK